MPRFVSVDDFAERLSTEESVLPPGETLLELARDFAREERERMEWALSWLTDVDQAICRLYFLEELTQEGISSLLHIGQPEVSGRLHSCIKLLPFLLKRPTRNPIELRNDFSELLPCRLVESAHALYLNFAPSRVADLLGPNVSESTTRNRRNEIVTHLEKLAALPSRGPYDHAALRGLRLIDPAGAVLADDEVARRRELAFRYLEDFRGAMKVSARLVRPFRKNEADRANALIKGKSIAS
ncbi:MAG: hypothetical protein ACJ8AW_21380 [Rhodopila sp.]